MDVYTREVPERLLAVIGKTVTQPELDEFVKCSFDKLFAWVVQHPVARPAQTTEAHPTYAIFHDRVTETEAALVEVCLVLDAPAPVEGSITIRTEEAHAEAYASLTRGGLDFPGILDVYNAVAMWAQANGGTRRELPPREVYVADVMAAGPGDVVASVAFPFTPAGT